MDVNDILNKTVQQTIDILKTNNINFIIMHMQNGYFIYDSNINDRAFACIIKADKNRRSCVGNINYRADVVKVEGIVSSDKDIYVILTTLISYCKNDSRSNFCKYLTKVKEHYGYELDHR